MAYQEKYYARAGGGSIPRVPTRQVRLGEVGCKPAPMIRVSESRVASSKVAVPRGDSGKMTGDQERLLSTPNTTQSTSKDTSVKLEGGSRIRSVYSIPGAPMNQHKYTGQEHKVAWTERREPEQP